MEMWVVSKSIELLSRYIQERFPVRVFLPLALFLSVAGLSGGRSVEGIGFTMTFCLASLLVFQFRLGDDLADRRRDWLEHPERVLPSARSTTPFHLLLILAMTGNLVLIGLQDGPQYPLFVFLILNGGLLLWYRWLRHFLSRPAVHYHVVLIKYPVFVYLLSGPSSQERGLLLPVSVLVYFTFCVFEALHDTKFYRPRLLALEMSALGLTSCLMVVLTLQRGLIPALFLGTLALGGILILVSLYRRLWNHLHSGNLSYGVFVIGFLQILVFTLGDGS